MSAILQIPRETDDFEGLPKAWALKLRKPT